MPTVYKSGGGAAACIYGRALGPSLAQAALTGDASTTEELEDGRMSGADFKLEGGG